MLPALGLSPSAGTGCHKHIVKHIQGTWWVRSRSQMPDPELKRGACTDTPMFRHTNQEIWEKMSWGRTTEEQCTGGLRYLLLLNSEIGISTMGCCGSLLGTGVASDVNGWESKDENKDTSKETKRQLYECIFGHHFLALEDTALPTRSCQHLMGLLICQ